MAELLAYWPNVLFATVMACGSWLYLKWIGFGPTPSEKKRESGELVYDHCSGENVEIDPLPCETGYVRIENGTITCVKCGESR